MDSTNCPFCNPPVDRVWLANDHAMALWDNFPCTAGHTLIVPRRHLASLFDATEEERRAMWDLVEKARNRLKETHSPSAFNIGLNDGPAAGQTVMHAHIHVIPRRTGDVPDPRGGIRCVIPDRLRYWDEGGGPR